MRSVKQSPSVCFRRSPKTTSAAKYFHDYTTREHLYPLTSARLISVDQWCNDKRGIIVRRTVIIAVRFACTGRRNNRNANNLTSTTTSDFDSLYDSLGCRETCACVFFPDFDHFRSGFRAPEPFSDCRCLFSVFDSSAWFHTSIRDVRRRRRRRGRRARRHVQPFERGVEERSSERQPLARYSRGRQSPGKEIGSVVRVGQQLRRSHVQEVSDRIVRRKQYPADRSRQQQNVGRVERSV